MSEYAADMDLSLFFIKHINNPCGTDENNIREFYIREAEKILPKMTNPFARELLEKIISQYKL